MSFGLSGDDKRSQMIGGDVAVGWIDQRGGHVLDYFLDSKSQVNTTVLLKMFDNILQFNIYNLS